MSLKATDITVTFGGVTAVNAVSIEIEPAAALSIVGPNGSGKTTLLNAIGGLLPAHGRVEVDGTEMPMARPTRIARAGVARTFQTPQVIDDLSCIDNVLLSSADRTATDLVAAWLTRPAMLKRERRRWAEAAESLERFGLAEHAEAPASRLTYGQRRWLELARVAVAHPRYLFADEPSAGLNDVETDVLAGHLRALRDDGIGIALVDHKVDFLRTVTETAVVLALGNKIAEAPIRDVWDLPEVQEAYLGSRRVRD